MSRQPPPHLTAESADVSVREVRERVVRRDAARKRVLDLGVGVPALVACLPLGLVIAVLVKLTSRGPVLFRQERVGSGGECFELIKFRTMRHGTHQEVLQSDELRAAYVANGFKLRPDDERITKVGRFLRKTSLDELPQLVNVVRGEMSLVGIRPLLKVELELRDVSDQAIYQLMRPGMTGLWQVEGRSTVHPVDRLRLDRRYVETWSLWNDVKLLARTPLAVLRIHQAD